MKKLLSSLLVLSLTLGSGAPCLAFGEEVNTVYSKVGEKRNYRFKEKSQDDSSCHKLKNFLIAAAGAGLSAVGYLYGKKTGFSDGFKKGKLEIADEQKKWYKNGFDEGFGQGKKVGYYKGSEEMLDDMLYPFLDEKTEFEETKNTLIQYGYNKGLQAGLIKGLKNCNNPDYAMLKLIAENMPL